MGSESQAASPATTPERTTILKPPLLCGGFALNYDKLPILKIGKTYGYQKMEDAERKSHL